jgi:hypothetical protein
MLQDRNTSKELLLKLLSIELLKDGFHSKFSHQAFYKNIPNGKWGLHFSFLDRAYGFEVMVDVAVRLDSVEELVNNYPVNPLLSDKERKQTFTVGTNCRTNGKPPIWEVEFENEIPEVTSSIVKLIREKGLAFLNYNSSLENVITTLQNDLAAESRALTVAYLIKNKDLFNEIAEKQKKLHKGRKDYRLNNFLILESELSTRFN